jgi:hypothetical protein
MDETFLSMMLADPEFAKTLAGMGVYGDSQGLLGQQLSRMHELSQVQQPEGRNVGHTYVAASPLEHMAAAMQRYKGMQGMQSTAAQQQALVDQDRQARMRLAQAFAQGARQQPQQPAPPDQAYLLDPSKT